MLETGNVTELYSFLGEYSHFFEHMAKCEKEKLDAILQNKLPLLESTIATAQANAMQLSNMEKKRLELQKKAGFEGFVKVFYLQRFGHNTACIIFNRIKNFNLSLLTTNYSRL